jgi:hypothetical protein
MTETTIKAGCAATDLIDGGTSGGGDGDANGDSTDSDGDANGGSTDSDGDANGGSTDSDGDANGGLTDSPISFISVFAPLVMAVIFAAL